MAPVYGGTSSDELERRWSVPGLPPQLVDRPALLHRLDEVADRSLISVTGPAGSGKSVLVAQWCRERCPMPVVWVELGGDDPVTAIRTMTNAIGDLIGERPVVEGGWLADGGDGPARLDPATTEWLADLLAGAPESVLVIDGIDASEPFGVHVDLARALEQARNCGIRLITTGRRIPPPEIVPLQLRSAASHIDAADLALDAAEVAAVIAAYAGTSIDHSAAERLSSRLEGWMAGAAIVGMSHPGGPGRSADELFDGAFGAIDAYVTAQILNPLTSETQRFLMLTASIDQIDPDLCDSMIGRDDGEYQLDTLRTLGVPIERHASRAGSYRYLRPVREVLDAHAMREVPRERESALRVAAEWYSGRQRAFDAARCWVRLDDWDQVIHVILLHLQQILDTDEISQLAELVTSAPPAVFRRYPGLALSAAWVLRMDGRVGAAYELLAVHEQHMSTAGRMIADVTRAGVASWTDDVDGALAFADAAVAAAEGLSDDVFEAADTTLPYFTETTVDTFRSLAHRYALLACAYGGMWEQGAAHDLDVAPGTAASLPQLQIVQLYGDRATFYALSGRALDAMAEAAAGLAVANDSGLLGHRSSADALYALGEASRLVLDHHRAADAFEQSRSLAEINGRRNLITAIVASHAHLRVDTGESSGALELIEQHRAVFSHRPPAMLAGLLATAEARALAAAGAHRQALRMLDLAPSVPMVAMWRVAISLALGNAAHARETVQRWPTQPTVDSAVRRALAAAVIHDASGERKPANAAFRSALDAAVDHDLSQPFTELGPLITRLLHRAKSDAASAASDLARRVHAAIAGGKVAVIAPRLTPREAMVISRLAEGLTLAEVADEIHLSVNTVKTHVKAIYRKLGVSSRVEAISVWSSAMQPSRDR